MMGYLASVAGQTDGVVVKRVWSPSLSWNPSATLKL